MEITTKEVNLIVLFFVVGSSLDDITLYQHTFINLSLLNGVLIQEKQKVIILKINKIVVKSLPHRGDMAAIMLEEKNNTKLM